MFEEDISGYVIYEELRIKMFKKKSMIKKNLKWNGSGFWQNSSRNSNIESLGCEIKTSLKDVVTIKTHKLY